jgi:dienelactone hydrolase
VSIGVSGLAPRSLVTITAATRPHPGQVWRSSGTFRADGAGRVVVSRDASLAGSYRGRYPMGLFWSMHLAGSKLPFDQQDLYFELPTVTTVRLSASVSGRTAARATLTRRLAEPDVTERKTTLAGEGFVGCYYAAPPAAKPTPAVVLLGGSEGGLPCHGEASLLASHGYATLALAYFGVPGLPADLRLIPLEYFEHAFEWLGGQPGVDPAKLAVLGISRGGEAAMLLGSTFPALIHAVVEYVGSNVVFGQPAHRPLTAAWTLGGRPIPPGTQIPVEKIDGPTFLVGALEDMLGPSAAAAQLAASQIERSGRNDTTVLVYRCGHSVGRGVPNVPTATVLPHTRYGPLDLGGTPNEASLARAESWQKLLAFLAHLR